MRECEDIIDLELRADGSYGRTKSRPDGEPSSSEAVIRHIYWVSGFMAGLLAGFILFGHPAKVHAAALSTPLSSLALGGEE